MQLWIVVPTYNEADNIERFITAVLAVGETISDVHIVIVDDQSPDGTGQLADQLAARDHRVEVIHRDKKDGLGRAYLTGFRYALDHGAELLVQIDADFSHDPDDIARLVTACKTADLAIGSRYTSGGSTGDWSRSREWLSRCGSLAARSFLRLPVKDLSGGFKCWHATTLEPILDQITAHGFVFQAETTFLAYQAGADIVEVPITFHERQFGQSKMSLAITIEGLIKVVGFRWTHRHHH